MCTLLPTMLRRKKKIIPLIRNVRKNIRHMCDVKFHLMRHSIVYGMILYGCLKLERMEFSVSHSCSNAANEETTTCLVMKF